MFGTPWRRTVVGDGVRHFSACTATRKIEVNRAERGLVAHEEMGSANLDEIRDTIVCRFLIFDTRA
jgi:hypothetical protein